VAARVYVWEKIGVEMHGEVYPNLYRGCGRSLGGLKFELEIKSEFLLKMKYHKIQRLEECRVHLFWLSPKEEWSWL
jgi:hypothetical protein